MKTRKLVALQNEQYITKHRPKQFSVIGTQVTVIDFTNQVERSVWITGGYSPTKSDQLINVVVWCVIANIGK
jgi:hypothetical protein